jgi:ADP-heptose:LPS heptosyltransferase
VIFRCKGIREWWSRWRRGDERARQLVFAARCLFDAMSGRRSLVIVERPEAGIGDMLAVAAGCATLAQEKPRARLVLVVAPQNRALARSANLRACITAPESATHFLARRMNPVSVLRARLPDEEQPPRPRPRRPLAEEFAAGLGLARPTHDVRLAPARRVQSAIDRRLTAAGLAAGKFLVVHTGPTWEVKEWPASSWAALAESVRTRLALPVVQIGTDETSSGATRRAARWPGAIDWMNRLTLVETAAALRRAALFLGVDSGPLHIARAVDCRAVGLFGPTDGACFLPASRRTTPLQTTLPCIACHHDPAGPRHWRTGCPHEIACMRLLSPAAVLQAMSGLLAPANGALSQPSLA